MGSPLSLTVILPQSERVNVVVGRGGGGGGVLVVVLSTGCMGGGAVPLYDTNPGGSLGVYVSYADFIWIERFECSFLYIYIRGTRASPYWSRHRVLSSLFI